MSGLALSDTSQSEEEVEEDEKYRTPDDPHEALKTASANDGTCMRPQPKNTVTQHIREKIPHVTYQ